MTGEAHPPGYEYQPSNVIFGLFPPLPGPGPEVRTPRGPRRPRPRRAFQVDYEVSETSSGTSGWTGESAALDQGAVAR